MELNEERQRFLAEKRFAVLATIGKDGLPQQSVMWYELDGDEILMNTARGRQKDTNLLRDDRVSLCFEDEYNWLTIVGTAQLNDEQEQAQADIRRLAIRYHGEEKGEQMSVSSFSKQERVSIRVKIERVVGSGI